MTVGETFDNFILSRKLADLSAKTIIDYIEFITPFIEFVGSYKLFSELTQKDINQYIQKLLERPISKATRATYIRHLKIYLRWSENEYGALYNAKSIKVPKSPKKSVRIYSDTEICDIFNAVSADADWIVFRNKCIIALMYDSGLRQSEVCTLKRSKISYTDNRMTVYGKGDKERIVPLGKLTKQFMREYIARCPYMLDTVFVNRRGQPLTGNAVKVLISKLSHKLDFELSSHKLRHNFATNYCIDQYKKYGQIDIYRLMYLMGHEDIETTKRYLHFAYEVIASNECISHLDSVMQKCK